MESVLLLNDLLHLSEDELLRSKVKFNQFNGEINPMEEYKSDPSIVNCRWLFWRQTQRFFSIGQIAICFLKLTGDHWLLTTIKTVDEELNVENGINYTGEELSKYGSLFGRVVVKYHKQHQTQCVFMKNVAHSLEVVQVLPSIFDGEDFPGYDKVRLSYSQLKTIISRNKRDWVAALENQKAVYLITDLCNGKHYVGSAYGENGMLLQRWRNYVDNGHGGNKELVALVGALGFSYIQNHFQYSILENYNARVDKSIILQRESWWKEALASRAFGYNSN